MPSSISIATETAQTSPFMPIFAIGTDLHVNWFSPGVPIQA
jgi:hypothetical protein